MCALRGDDIGMVFQEPMTALNPLKTIGEQVAEGIRWHTRREPSRRRGAGAKDARPGRAAGRKISPLALSARTVGRPAPARGDRDRLRAQAEAADRRRADDSARRRAAGADPRTAARSRRREPHGLAADLARSRRRHRNGRPHHHPARTARSWRRARRQRRLSAQAHPYTRQLAQASMHVPSGGGNVDSHLRLAPSGSAASALPSKTSPATIRAGAPRSSTSRRRCAPSTTSRSRLAKAIRWRWSAARAAASPRSPA